LEMFVRLVVAAPSGQPKCVPCRWRAVGFDGAAAAAVACCFSVGAVCRQWTCLNFGVLCCGGCSLSPSLVYRTTGVHMVAALAFAGLRRRLVWWSVSRTPAFWRVGLTVTRLLVAVGAAWPADLVDPLAPNTRSSVVAACRSLRVGLSVPSVAGGCVAVPKCVVSTSLGNRMVEAWSRHRLAARGA